MIKLACKLAGVIAALSFSQLGSASALALEKTFDPGRTTEAFRRHVTCRITKNQLILERRVAGLSSRTQEALNLSGDFAAIIAKAALGQIETGPAPADVPTVAYRAFYEGQGLASQEVLLRSRGAEVYTNQAQEAQQLVNFIDLHCPSY